MIRVEPNERADAVRYRVTYRPEVRRDPELVEADDVIAQGAAVVLRRAVLVVGQPREVVVLRLCATDIPCVAVEGAEDQP